MRILEISVKCLKCVPKAATGAGSQEDVLFISPGQRGVKMKDDNSYQGLKAVGLIMSAGATMAASVLFGYYAGSWLDKYFGTKPWLTIIMFVLGTAAGLKSLYDLAFPKKGGD